MFPISITKGTGASESQSFTQMADKDLESIGRHCQFEYCNQLDFLPFRCESCRGTYCLDHRTEIAHRCPQEGEWARRRNGNTAVDSTPTEKPTIYNSDQCAHVSCKTLINTLKDPGVRCPDCSREYCLKHRLKEEHDCAKIAPRLGTSAEGPASGDTVRSMFARVRSWGKDKSQAATAAAAAAKPKPKPNSAAARMAQTTAMKKAAKGDPGIPADRRVYLHVVGTSETQGVDPPNGDFWFDSKWKVGRVLDDAAKRLGVENLNNRVGEEARLRVFHVESGEFLEFSDAIGTKVKTADTVVLLRGAGVMLGK